MADVRLIVTLFDNVNFAGPFRTVVADLNDLRLIEFNDRTSSVRVTRGPNFRTGDAAVLFENVNYGGRSLSLPPGDYPDLRAFNFNDEASSIRITGGAPPPPPPPPPDNVVAQDTQRETLQFNLRVVVPTGTTLVSVDQNRILNPTATGQFVGDTGVQVNGSFTDQLVVTIRDASGVTRQATGQATVNFTKNINFPQLAGLNKNNLAIRVSFANINQSFTVSGNIVTKTVSFDLTTRVIRLLTSQAVQDLEDYIMKVE